MIRGVPFLCSGGALSIARSGCRLARLDEPMRCMSFIAPSAAAVSSLDSREPCGTAISESAALSPPEGIARGQSRNPFVLTDLRSMPASPATLVVYRDGGIWIELNRTRLSSVRLMQWRPDFVPVDPESERIDLLAGLPFDTLTLDAIYAYHVLEHLDLHEGRRFLAECLRVLRPGGWLRVSVPDFVNHLRTYLECLEAARDRPDDLELRVRLEFTRVLLLDQRVRRRSGGRMLELLRTAGVDREFAIRTLGLTGPWLLDIARGTPRGPRRSAFSSRSTLRAAISSIRRRLEPRRRLPWWQRDCRETRELEITNWDEVSLTRELAAAGFEEVSACTTAGSSRLPGWSDLDRCPNTGVDIERSAIAEGRRP